MSESPPPLPADEAAARPALWRRLPRVVRTTLGALVGLELLAASVLPAVVPRHHYLRLYLGFEAQQSAEAVATGEDPFLVYDATTGWRSRPSVERGKWRVDAAGLRSTRPVARDHGPQPRVLFLGNSLVNGGTGVKNEETISAYIEREQLEPVNAATMLFALDQMLLSYERWQDYAPDVVVVGVGNVPAEGLDGCYVPFLRKQEKNIPLLKPCYRLEGKAAALHPVPPAEAHLALTRDVHALRRLESYDPSYEAFVHWQRFGVTPLAAALDGLWAEGVRAREVLRDTPTVHPARPLALRLMHDFVDARRAEGRHVLFLALPDLQVARTDGWRSRLPDHYGARIAALRESGLPVLDARDALRESPDVHALYSHDGVHYSPEGNRVIASVLAPVIKALLSPDAR